MFQIWLWDFHPFYLQLSIGLITNYWNNTSSFAIRVSIHSLCIQIYRTSNLKLEPCSAVHACSYENFIRTWKLKMKIHFRVFNDLIYWLNLEYKQFLKTGRNHFLSEMMKVLILIKGWNKSQCLIDIHYP